MDIQSFGDNKTGELVPITGVRGATHSFIPDTLPPKWNWPEHLWQTLMDARTAVAGLNGIGKHIPNPNLLLRPLQHREAKCSSSLEGTITEPTQQMLFELNPKYPSSERDPINEYREVFNYGRALRCRFERRVDLPLSLRLIRELHGILMEGVRGRDQDPGNFRRVQNQIGAPPRFVPPPPNYLMDCLDQFEKYLHGDKNFDPLVESFIAHYQFEAIHPFRDGNGRVGRLLLSIMISEWLNLSNPWLYMSAFFDRNKDQYIDRMLKISTDGDWEGWIRFCLEGTIEQVKDTEKRCERLLALSRNYKEKILQVGGSIRLNTIVDDLFISPVVQIPQIVNRCEITYPTAKSDIDKLCSVGILSEMTEQSVKTFLCPDIIDITYGE